MPVERYGRVDTVQVATVAALWYGTFADTPGRLVLVRDPDTRSGYDLAIFTTDLQAAPEQVVARYADRWSLETSNATGKQVLGIGQARNRVSRAVERTVPFEFLIQTLITYWYATAGYHRDDLTGRLATEPWYTAKTEPAFEDMLAKLRRTLIAARFTATTPTPLDPNIIRDYQTRLRCRSSRVGAKVEEPGSAPKMKVTMRV